MVRDEILDLYEYVDPDIAYEPPVALEQVVRRALAEVIVNSGAKPGAVQEWFTAEQAATYLGLPSANAVYRRHARGQLKGYRAANGRSLRFRRRDLDAPMRAA